jgi:glycosyltransferase involved in cell wall biosynthesis
MNNSAPIVSIVMAAFNEEKYIAEAIESVLNQSFTEFEFIIINDGSTDKTEAIILSYNDPRIRYIKNEQNLKLIASLNKGLKTANGKYIARMDSDDVCVPSRLEKQVAFMEAHPEIGISGAQLLVFGSEEGVMQYPLSHEDIKLRLFITSCFGNNVVIFRKELLEAHDLYFPQGYLHAEDYKCWTNWVAVTKTANLSENLVKYRSHANSVSVQHRTLQRATRNRVRKEYISNAFTLNEETASAFAAAVSPARLRALASVLQINKRLNYVPQPALTKTLLELWYLDSLEEAESSIGVIFQFPLIFRFGLKKNFKNWVYVCKHYLKFRFAK